MSRTPNDDYKISAASLIEIRQAVNGELERIRREFPDLQVLENRALDRAHMVVSWYLWMLRQPKKLRNEAIRTGSAIYREHLASDAPLDVIVDPDGSGDANAAKGLSGADPGRGTGKLEGKHNGAGKNGTPGRTK